MREIGLYPKCWSKSVFGDIYDIRLGKMLSQKSTESGEQLPYVANFNIRWDGFDTSIMRRMSFSEKERIKFRLKTGDLLVCEGGEVGRCSVWDERIQPCYYQKAVHRLRPKRHNLVHVFFTKCYLERLAKTRRISSIVGDSSIAHLTREKFISLFHPLPPIPEQEAIASVLQCWDKGVRQLEAKIAAKERVKKGLMQQLLSGQLRLSGFGEVGKWVDGEWQMPGDWSRQCVGEVFSYVKSHAFSREQLTDESASEPYIYNIHYGDLHARYPGPLLDFEAERRVPVLKDSASAGGLAYLQSGDLIMADVSEDFEGVGACVELVHLNGRKVTAGLHTFVLRDTAGATVDGFRGYLFKEHTLAKELRRIATGVSVHGISKTNLAEVTIALPSLEEQKAIVRVLSAADHELDALRRKLEAWKAQKKYLLNNLVDGTIRLPEFVDTEKEVVG